MSFELGVVIRGRGSWLCRPYVRSNGLCTESMFSGFALCLLYLFPNLGLGPAKFEALGFRFGDISDSGKENGNYYRV